MREACLPFIYFSKNFHHHTLKWLMGFLQSQEGCIKITQTSLHVVWCGSISQMVHVIFLGGGILGGRWAKYSSQQIHIEFLPPNLMCIQNILMIHKISKNIFYIWLISDPVHFTYYRNLGGIMKNWYWFQVRFQFYFPVNMFAKLKKCKKF